MIAYLIKSTISLLLCYLAYRLFLSKEKIHQFNRFFLLASIIFSLLAPLFHSPIRTSTEVAHFSVMSNPQLTSEQTAPKKPRLSLPEKLPETAALPIAHILIGIYSIFLMYFLLRYAITIWNFYRRTMTHQVIDRHGIKFVMDSCKDTPYTFFQYVFVNDTAYQKKQLDPRLLHHELVHAKQWHSIDILLVELLKAIFWFNPIFHLYKKAIQLNHEFLADESVNRQFGNINAYQNLLLSYAGQQQQNKLVSYSKHSLTKTRLIMMRKEKNLSNILLKLALIIPFILGGTFLFSMKPQRTTAPKAIPQKVTPHPPSAPPQGDYLEEYKQHYQHLQELMDKKGKVNLNEIDIDRMRQLWDFMSDKQKEKAPKVHGVPAPPIPEKKHASNYQMEEWTTNHDYGIWLDDTLVPNEELSGFSSKDIAYWQYSRLYKNAKNYDKYKTRVSLMTHDGFYKTFIMKETGFDQLTAYNKAIEIYTAHQKHPKKNAGQLGGKLSDLQQVYNHIPQWKKEKYEVKPPSEIIKNL